MSNELVPASDDEPLTLTDQQHEAFLAAIRDNRIIGNITALRAAGVQGRRGQLRALLTDELLDEAREARGWSIQKVEDAVFTVASNPEHPSFQRTAAMVLKAYHPAYQDRQHLDVNHSGEVGNPDVADAVERLNALVSAAAVRAATRAGTQPVPGLPVGTGESPSRLPVERMDREAEPGTT